jgi:hypothetical protein
VSLTFSGVTPNITWGALGLTVAGDLTVFMRFRPTTLTGYQAPVVLNEAGGDGKYIDMLAGGPTTPRAKTINQGVSESVTSTASIATNTWHSLGGAWTANTSRQAWIGSTKYGPTVATISGMTAPTAFLIGYACIGDLADIGVWPAVLTDREWNAFRFGFPARRIRPTQLLVSMRGLNSLLQEVRASGQGTATGVAVSTTQRHRALVGAGF